MTYKTRLNIYGRKHIHEHIRALAAWQRQKNANHSISEEYDQILVAGIKAKYGQDVPIEIAPPEANEQPPAVAAHG